MGLSSAGIGSGLDVQGIVAKLMSVEQQPLALLAKTETSYQAKLSGFGTLKGALAQFQTTVKGLSDISKFQAVKAAAVDPAIASITGTPSAQPGNYSLFVSQLAQSQKLVAAGTASQVAPIGNGVISFDFGTITGTVNPATSKYDPGATFTTAGNGVKTVTIDATNNSLSGIRDAINAAGIGVSAKIVNDGGATPYRLSLTSTVTGKAASMKISVDDAGGPLGSLLNNDPAASQAMTQTAAAQNAEMLVDGIAVSKQTNSINDVIDGLTFNLQKVSTTATSVNVTRDTASVTTSVNAFVKAYNEITQTLRDAQAIPKAGGKAAVLNGEASVRNIQTQVRNVMSASVGGGAGALSNMSQIGVTMGKDGLLSVDSAKLDKVIASNFDDLAGLFAAAGKASDSLTSYTGSSAATVPGAYALNVTQLATNGNTVGNSPADLTIGPLNNTYSVRLNGITANVTLDQKTYLTAADLATELQSKINGVKAFSSASAAVQVSETGGVLKITSTLFGSGSTVSVIDSAVPTLKFDAAGANVISGLDVAGTINGKVGTGSGKILTGATGDPSEGLRVTINATAPGALGTINYSKGYAYQFDQLTTGLLATTGTLNSRTEGINASIKGIEKKRADINARLLTVEKRYLAQFTALDLTLSKMTTTSTFLGQQLTQISNLSSE